MTDAARVQRFDFGGFRAKPRKTSQGFLKISGNLTRTGVLTYTRPDGSTFRELRHPEEVFKADSLASLEGAPVTDLHPTTGAVTPANVRDVQRGFVSGAVRQDADRFLAGDITIQDADLIKQVEVGNRREFSPGYTCWVETKSGEWNGQRYDGIQRGIVYNHLALGPKGWGRSGSDVALHLDGATDPTVGVEFRTDDLSAEKEEQTMDTLTLRVDGIDYEVAKSAAPHIEKAIAERDARVAALTADLDKATARADAADKAQKETQAKLDAVDVGALVAARVTLENAARVVLGAEWKADGKSDTEIRLEAIVKAEPEFKADGKSADYVSAYFDAVASRKPEPAKTPEQDAAAKALAATKTGNEDRTDAESARERNAKRNRDAWQQPLAYSKDAPAPKAS